MICDFNIGFIGLGNLGYKLANSILLAGLYSMELNQIGAKYK